MVSPRKGGKWVPAFPNRPWQPKCWRPWESTLPTAEILVPQPLTGSIQGDQTETHPQPRPGFASRAPDCYDAQSEQRERGGREEHKSQGLVTVVLGEGKVGRVSIRGCKTAGKLALKTGPNYDFS